MRFCKDRSLCSKEWVACGPSPVSPDLWAWPALLETKVEHDLHVNHLSRFEALLLALLCSCFPLLAYDRCKDRSLCSKEWVACGPSPVSPDLWAWPALLESKMEHDLHVNHSSRFEALLLALLCSCFPLLAYEVPRQLDFTWASLSIFSWIHTLYWASESSSVPALGALT